MKKFAVTLAAFALIFSVSGCAKDEEEEPSGPPATIATPTTKSVPNEGSGGKDGAGATPTFDKQAAYNDVASAFSELPQH